MNKQERQTIWAKANDKDFADHLGEVAEQGQAAYWNQYLNWADGIAYCSPGDHRYCTVDQAAAVLRYQAKQLDGGWDSEQVQITFALFQRHAVLLEVA